jgi:3-hydroxybutyryl-CoA dehydrogenase
VGAYRIARCDGRPLSARPDIDVLIDEVRDIDTAKIIVMTARSTAAHDAAAGFFHAGGRSVIAIADRPGLLALRTMAQLANAAADAVLDGVATADGIDEAMIFGANHPEGPLTWARRVGFDVVRNALNHIADHSGDALYRPSTYLQ